MLKWLVIVWCLLAGVTGLGIVITGVWRVEQHAEQCQAARETVLLEQQLLDWTGEFPPEQVTDRWKKLLGGCQ